jgi:hypothetical protein
MIQSARDRRTTQRPWHFARQSFWTCARPVAFCPGAKFPQNRARCIHRFFWFATGLVERQRSFPSLCETNFRRRARRDAWEPVGKTVAPAKDFQPPRPICEWSNYRRPIQRRAQGGRRLRRLHHPFLRRAAGLAGRGHGWIVRRFLFAGRQSSHGRAGVTESARAFSASLPSPCPSAIPPAAW